MQENTDQDNSEYEHLSHSRTELINSFFMVNISRYIHKLLLQKLPRNDNLKQTHCVKRVCIWSYSGPYFPVFSPNAGKYEPD